MHVTIVIMPRSVKGYMWYNKEKNPEEYGFNEILKSIEKNGGGRKHKKIQTTFIKVLISEPKLLLKQSSDAHVLKGMKLIFFMVIAVNTAKINRTMILGRTRSHCFETLTGLGKSQE